MCSPLMVVLVVGINAHLQFTIVLSTMETEYMFVEEAFKEAIWLKGYLENSMMGWRFIPYIKTVKVSFS